jgi:hypothetical protein
MPGFGDDVRRGEPVSLQAFATGSKSNAGGRARARFPLSHTGECAVLSLILAALFFAGIHLGIAGTAMRDRAIGILGKNGYTAAFAVASVIGLVWLVTAYNRAPYFVTWGMLEWWKPIAIILMLPASLLVVIGLTTPNPTSVAQEGRVGQPAAGDRPDHASPVPDGRRPLGGGASGRQWRCRVPGLFRDLGHRRPRWHRIDRRKASTALGGRLGAICGADLASPFSYRRPDCAAASKSSIRAGFRPTRSKKPQACRAATTGRRRWHSRT